MTSVPRLLLVEDDKALATILQEYLHEVGYSLTMCQDGDTALSLLKQKHFDIVLSDIVLPGEQDGWAILGAASDRPADTLVILMTGYAGMDDAATAVEKGAYDFISKPIQFPELRVRLDNAVRYQNLLRAWMNKRGDDLRLPADPMTVPKAVTRLYRDHHMLSAHANATGYKE